MAKTKKEQNQEDFTPVNQRQSTSTDRNIVDTAGKSFAELGIKSDPIISTSPKPQFDQSLIPTPSKQEVPDKVSFFDVKRPIATPEVESEIQEGLGPTLDSRETAANRSVVLNDDGTVTYTPKGGFPEILSQEEYQQILAFQQGGQVSAPTEQFNRLQTLSRPAGPREISNEEFAQQFISTESAEPVDISLADARRSAFYGGAFEGTPKGIGKTINTIMGAHVGKKVLSQVFGKAALTKGAVGKTAATIFSAKALIAMAAAYTAYEIYQGFTSNLKGEHLEDVEEVSQFVTSALGRGFSTIQSEVRRGGLSPEQGQIMLNYIDEEMNYAERLLQQKRMQGRLVKDIVDTPTKKQLAKIRSYKTKYRVILVQAIAEAAAGNLDPNAPMLIFDQEEFDKGGFEDI